MGSRSPCCCGRATGFRLNEPTFDGTAATDDNAPISAVRRTSGTEGGRPIAVIRRRGADRRDRQPVVARVDTV